jgi:diguanylate cyclase (GGDEF)-like protein/PAS domain S-box-containing protein
MGVQLTPAEGFALYGLLAETGTDIILKTDRRGFVVHATPALELLGFALPDLLFGPHLAELAAPCHVDGLRAEHAAVIAGRRSAQWTEFPARMADGRTAWFELQLRPLTDERARVYGALGVMRNVDERRALEERLFAAAMTDPLTGLTNRSAFTRMLAHLVETGASGHLALFDLDHFRTINLRHGHSGGDRVLVAFARLLRTLLREDDILSRIDGGTFGVLLPEAGQWQATAACERVVGAMGEMGVTTHRGHRLTASAGVAAFAGRADATLREAELALLSAKSRGRARVERAGAGLFGRTAA